jgi:hypothetical protein
LLVSHFNRDWRHTLTLTELTRAQAADSKILHGLRLQSPEPEWERNTDRIKTAAASSEASTAPPRSNGVGEVRRLFQGRFTTHVSPYRNYF